MNTRTKKYLKAAWPLSLMLTTALSLGLAWSPSAQASSMPKADLKGKHSISLGSAPSLGLEFSLSPKWALGAAVGMPLFYEVSGFLRYNFYSSYTFLEADALTVRGLVGAFGDVDLYQRADVQLSNFGVEAGIAVAYQINQWVTARANVVPGLAFPYSTGFGLFTPSGGVEVAYRPFDNFEATLGLNGNGDIFALRYLF